MNRPPIANNVIIRTSPPGRAFPVAGLIEAGGGQLGSPGDRAAERAASGVADPGYKKPLRGPAAILALISLSVTAPLRAQEASWEAAEEVLATRCVECHGAAKDKGGLRLDTKAALLKGGDDGASAVPGKPDESKLLARVLLPDDDDDRMPPLGDARRPRLTNEEAAALKSWIQADLPWPEGKLVKVRAPGEKAALAAAKLKDLTIHPSEIVLSTPKDIQSLTLLATLEDGTQRDVTDYAKFAWQGEPVAAVQGNVLKPVKMGESKLLAGFNGSEAVATVKVSGQEVMPPLRFVTDVIPVLTRYGCNSGACHGSARGQDGFHVSLFGFDPKGDYDFITRQQLGRRLDLASPADSLMVTKAVGATPHGGGKRFDPESEAARVLVGWIEAGAQPDPPDAPVPVRIAMQPGGLLLAGEGRTVGLRVTAFYNDGSDRDVTSLAVFSSSNADSVAVDEFGTLTSKKRGEAFVMARFHTFTEGVPVLVIPENAPYRKIDDPGGNMVDQHVNAKLEKLRLTPSALCTDEEFLRRVTLDINGRLPTLEEQDAFAAEAAPDKRARLVDRLLERKEFTELWVMKWAELLQIRTNDQLGLSYKATLLYFNWLQDRIARNVPLDEMVRELLGASGGTFANPPTNFYQGEQDMLKFSENVAQVFTGARLQCSQCHNHPFDRWTLDDYYGWAAFFAQIGKKTGDDPRETVVFNKGGGGVVHPVTKGDVAPKFLGGAVPDVAGKDRRVVVAEWLTSPENPFFSRNIANIVWAHFMGRGVVEPVDDVRLSNPPSNPELLTALAERLRSSRYDLRDLVRLICNSHAYQRSTVPNETNKLDLKNFSHAQVRRIRAEVLFDVLAEQTATKNKFKGLPVGARAVQIADGNVSNYFLTTFGRASRTTVCSCEVKLDPNLSQALHLINGEMTHQKVKEGGLVAQWLKENKSGEDIVTAIYRRALCRKPLPTELSSLLAQVPEKPEEKRAYFEDAFWAVLNCKEFVFNH